MYEYKIVLPFKVENCTQCPFRNQQMSYEPIQSIDVINGVTQITRIESYCMVKDEKIFKSEAVNGFNTTCPLKDRMKEIKEGTDGNT